MTKTAPIHPSINCYNGIGNNMEISDSPLDQPVRRSALVVVQPAVRMLYLIHVALAPALIVRVVVLPQIAAVDARRQAVRAGRAARAVQVGKLSPSR